MCQLTEDAQDPGDQDSPKNTAFYVFGEKDRCYKNSDQRQKYSDSLRGKGSF